MKNLAQHITESFAEINEKGGDNRPYDFANQFSDDNLLLVAIEKAAKKSANFVKKLVATVVKSKVKGSEALLESEFFDIDVYESVELVNEKGSDHRLYDFANQFSDDNELLVAIEKAIKGSAKFAKLVIDKIKTL